jgi:hypothetical protein
MKMLTDALAGILHRPVLDETNLTGSLNLRMQFADLHLQVTPEAIADAGAASRPSSQRSTAWAETGIGARPRARVCRAETRTAVPGIESPPKKTGTMVGGHRAGISSN